MSKGGRGRRQRERRPRSSSAPDPLPSPEVFDAELRALVIHTLKLKAQYRRAYIDGLAPAGGSGLSINGGTSNATEASFMSKVQIISRVKARLATERMREAAGWVTRANAVLEWSGTVQPEKIDPRATISQRELDERLKKKAPPDPP